MKTHARKLIWIILLTVCVLCVFLSGCGSNTTQADRASAGWVVDEETYGDGCAWISWQSPYLYVLGTDGVLKMLDKNSGETLQNLDLSDRLQLGQWGEMNTICCDTEAVWVAYTITDAQDTQQTVVSQLDWTGAVLGETLLTFSEDVDSLEQGPVSILLYGDGTVVATARELFYFEDGGTLTEQAETNGYITQLYLDQDGTLYYLNDQTLYTVGSEEQTIELNTTPVSLISGDETYEVMAVTTSGLYGWNSDGGEGMQLVDWDALPFDGRTVYAAYLTQDDVLIAQVVDYSVGTYCLLQCSYVESVPEKQVLTVAYLGGEPGELATAAIQAYNLHHSDYEFQLVGYEDADQLKLELATGDGPDVLFCTFANGVSIEDYVSYNTLIDLYPYLDADETLSRESFIPNYLDCLSQNGSLYALSAGMTLHVYFAAEGRIESPEDLTAERLLELAKEMDEPTVLAYVDHEGFLESILESCLDTFVDLQAGTCDFDNSTFRALLELARDHVDPTALEEGEAYHPAAGNTLLLAKAISSPASYTNMVSSGLEAASILNKEQLAVYAMQFGSFSITSCCAAPEEAWEMIRLMFSEYMQQLVSRVSLPALASTYENMEAAALTAETTTQTDAEAMRELMASACTSEYRNSPIIEMVLEECASYFAGDQTDDTVIAIIQDRVGTYLAERQ